MARVSVRGPENQESLKPRSGSSSGEARKFQTPSRDFDSLVAESWGKSRALQVDNSSRERNRPQGDVIMAAGGRGAWLERYQMAFIGPRRLYHWYKWLKTGYNWQDWPPLAH